MLCKGLEHKPALGHSRVRQLKPGGRQGQKGRRQQQVNVDAAALVARSVRTANATQKTLCFKAELEQGQGFASPFYLEHLVDKVRTLKTPRSSAPKASGSQNRSFCPQCAAGLRQNFDGVFAVAT